MNEFMSALNTKRSFANPTLTDLFSGRGVEDEDGNMSYTLPFMEDLLVRFLEFDIQWVKLLFILKRVGVGGYYINTLSIFKDVVLKCKLLLNPEVWHCLTIKIYQYRNM